MEDWLRDRSSSRTPSRHNTKARVSSSHSHHTGTKKSKSATERPSAIWQVLNFERWARAVLLTQIVTAGDDVLELMCASGHDMGIYKKLQISTYTGVDASELALATCRQRWEQKGKPFEATFLHHDLDRFSLEGALERDKTFDVVACFDGMQNSFVAEEQVRSFLWSATSRLRDGGYFIGLLPDSSAIWCKAQKEAQKEGSAKIRGKLFTFSFDDDLNNFKPFGTSYTRHIQGETSDPTEYMVHFPTLLQIAKQFHLEMIEITNFQEFYEDYKANFSTLLKSMAVLDKKGKIIPEQMDLIGLKTIFIFRKDVNQELA